MRRDKHEFRHLAVKNGIVLPTAIKIHVRDLQSNGAITARVYAARVSNPRKSELINSCTSQSLFLHVGRNEPGSCDRLLASYKPNERILENLQKLFHHLC
jgi:hypothetical protein